MNKLLIWFYNLYLVAILTGCMALQGPSIAPGDALLLNEGAVRHGIQTALGVAPGVARLLSPDKSILLVAWPQNGHQAWTFVTSATRGLEAIVGSSLSGQIANVKDWSGMKAVADALKWLPVTAGEAAAFLEGLGVNAAIIYRPNPMLALTWALASYLELNPYKVINPGVDS